MTLKAHEFDRIQKKLNLQTRNTGDKIAWFYHEGKKILRTKRSHGRGDLPAAHMIRQQLKVNEDQFRGLIDCSVELKDYIEILRGKNILPSAS